MIFFRKPVPTFRDHAPAKSEPSCCRIQKFNLRFPLLAPKSPPTFGALRPPKRRRFARTPQERQLIDDLFDRLAKLEGSPRDRDAEAAIMEGLRRAPNAAYALVQTVLVQDEALKRANARIQELEGELGIGAEPPHQAGFLDNMRDAVFGRREAPRATSVPTVRPGEAPMGVPPGYGAGTQPMSGPEPMRPGGSFLGTAAAAAAGVIGGSLLLDGIRSMTGHHQGAFGAIDPAGAATPDAATP